MDTAAGDLTQAGSSGPFRVALLGPLQVAPGLSAHDLGPPKQRELLAVLALHAGDVITHDVLADALWDGRPPRTFAHSLQLYVSGLRRILDAAGSPVSIATEARGYRLALAPDDVDLGRFRRVAGAGITDAEAGRWEVAVARLSEARGLWRGPPLAEFASREFAAEARASATALHLEASEALAAALLTRGDLAGARSVAREVLESDGLRERAASVLMTALHRSGRGAEALRTYEDLRACLDRELGTVPGPEARETHARILRQEESAGGHASPASVAVGDRSPARRRHWVWVAAAAAVALAVGVLAVSVDRGLRTAAGTSQSAPPGVLLVKHDEGEVNLLVEAGFDRAVSDFGLVADDVETGDLNAALTIEERVPEHGLVLDFTLGTDLADVARRHPATAFVALDEPGEASAPNLATIRFRTEEASFLAGYAAARTTQSGVIGFIGGVDFETIWPFEAGFLAGAELADPEVEVLVRYLSEPPLFGEGFENPALGERAARGMYGRGADVVFAAAGGSSLGVIEAATELSVGARHLWAIGVDSDKYETVATLPGTVDAGGWRRHILTSVVLRFDRVVYAALATFVRDAFRAGVQYYDLANDGVELSYSGGYLDTLRSELEGLRRAVVDGEVDVPCRPSRVPATGLRC